MTSEFEKACTEILEAAGYQDWHTGGGHMAWSKLISNHSNSDILVITNEDSGLYADPSKPIWSASRRDVDIGYIEVGCLKGMPLEEAIRIAEMIPPFKRGVQFDFDSKDEFFDALPSITSAPATASAKP